MAAETISTVSREKILMGLSGAESHGPVRVYGTSAVTDLDTNGTGSSRTHVTHGLGWTPSIVIPVMIGDDSDSADSPVPSPITIVAITSTVITVKSVAVAQPFELICFR